MRRDDLLHAWWSEHAPETVTWHDVGAGDGAVSRALATMRPRGSYSCWDPKPKHTTVQRIPRLGHIELAPVNVVLLNFCLHHVWSRGQVNALIRAAFGAASLAVLIQEDIDDGTAETRTRLRRHETTGTFLSAGEWTEKLRWLCDGAPVATMMHPEPAEDTLGYDVPRALFVVGKSPTYGQSATSGGPHVPQPFATAISSSVGSTGSQAS